MDDSTRFCGVCGKPFEDAGTSNNSTKMPGGSFDFSGVAASLNAGGVLTILYLAETLLFVLLGILNFAKTFKIDAWLISGKMSIGGLLKQGDSSAAFPVIVGILIFAAAALSVVPIFSAPKRRRFIFQIVVSVIAFAMLVIVYIAAANADGSAFYDVSLTFAGWLYLFICLITIALSVLISIKSAQK